MTWKTSVTVCTFLSGEFYLSNWSMDQRERNNVYLGLSQSTYRLLESVCTRGSVDSKRPHDEAALSWLLVSYQVLPEREKWCHEQVNSMTPYIPLISTEKKEFCLWKRLKHKLILFLFLANILFFILWWAIQ